ncbi:MAG: c-type cytochrome [Acidobacteriia bacterium]|nr:c-type cytochrome [Terriglobia bacterium]
MRRIGFLGLLIFTVLALAAWSQQPSTETPPQKIIKKVPIKPTAADSGEEMYKEYCAVCHGKQGKGDGPAASELKAPPPDLTMLTRDHEGKYPAERVAAVLRFGTEKPAPAHGTLEMPIWGRLLATSPVHGTNAAMVQLRIRNLTEYIETLQVK